MWFDKMLRDSFEVFPHSSPTGSAVSSFILTTNRWYCLVLHFKQIKRDKMIFHDCFHLLLWLLLSLNIFWFAYCFGGVFHFNCLFICVPTFFFLLGYLSFVDLKEFLVHFTLSVLNIASFFLKVYHFSMNSIHTILPKQKYLILI